MFLQRPLYRARKLREEIVSRSNDRLRRLLSRRGLMPPRVVHQMNLANSQMKRHYSMQPWDGELVVFRARNGLGRLDPRPDLGWNSQGVTNLRIVDVLGDHVTMLTDEISSLGPAVAAALAEARGRQTGS
jgi:thioesterase domain-containing protein